MLSVFVIASFSSKTGVVALVEWFVFCEGGIEVFVQSTVSLFEDVGVEVLRVVVSVRSALVIRLEGFLIPSKKFTVVDYN